MKDNDESFFQCLCHYQERKQEWSMGEIDPATFPLRVLWKKSMRISKLGYDEEIHTLTTVATTIATTTGALSKKSFVNLIKYKAD